MWTPPSWRIIPQVSPSVFLLSSLCPRMQSTNGCRAVQHTCTVFTHGWQRGTQQGLSPSLCVCLCSVRETEREREREKDRQTERGDRYQPLPNCLSYHSLPGRLTAWLITLLLSLTPTLLLSGSLSVTPYNTHTLPSQSANCRVKERMVVSLWCLLRPLDFFSSSQTRL